MSKHAENHQDNTPKKFLYSKWKDRHKLQRFMVSQTFKKKNKYGVLRNHYGKRVAGQKEYSTMR